MSIINPQTKEILCKIVYYGPALSGKTTSLLALQKKLGSSKKNGSVCKIPETSRTLFFDFLALSAKEKMGDYKVKFLVYTVPGQVLYEDSRRLLLHRVDGIIFVADSSVDHVQDSIRSQQELCYNLEHLGYNPDNIPTVIQYNKRDCKTAAKLGELKNALNPKGLADFETVAQQGKGVTESFETVLKLVMSDLKTWPAC